MRQRGNLAASRCGRAGVFLFLPFRVLPSVPFPLCVFDTIRIGLSAAVTGHKGS
jgi:hypothetical protein